MSLPAEIAREQQRVREVAAGSGLDFFETIFEMVDWDQMNRVASYDGFPIRYPHWREPFEQDGRAVYIFFHWRKRRPPISEPPKPKA